MKKEKGFTLIEMLIVLLVISVLLLITIPNVTKHNQGIQKKGCEGLINMVQAQATSYHIDNQEIPTMQDLKDNGYLRELPVCPNGNEVVISSTGEVSEVGS
ncbi:competence type IV pilus major pilin ComGC [Metabacillus halosaccharovorans]|uniref:ComG operon protein 3 n=1 Tax=Metabacillus halosaccharovorans TaxID=930124 RepID=A0ABT3DDB8_9BACI|nr:competence type IV pilus major pilin ComGC [Metabacillus halosaccharovorans]MCV9884828.1 competence type IV pilus major pilin ComGC [Metabacillus halosaccharovorans]